MTCSDTYFSVFHHEIKDPLPSRFTFPFYYQPHPLALMAVDNLQQLLSSKTHWQNAFGLSGNNESAKGKMFGVLVVKNKQGKLGYLSAFSGVLSDDDLSQHFVPPVFDIYADDDFFTHEQSKINGINDTIDELLTAPKLLEKQAALTHCQTQYAQALAEQKALMANNKAKRKQQRAALMQEMQAGQEKPAVQEKQGPQATQSELTLDNNDKLTQLNQASVIDKLVLRDLKATWQAKLDNAETELAILVDEIDLLKRDRKRLSAKLQRKIFKHYRFLNCKGQSKDLTELFIHTPEQKPPAGAGDCAAPKLLQYAFLQGYTPICMAEFWWGKAPKSEIRQHKNFYPACSGKCQPILAHMLDGMALDDNLMVVDDKSAEKIVEIVYQDEHIAVINKPEGLLSVPGKAISDCVYARMKMAFPQATGPLIVHRLDMSTSGLMVIALSKRANKQLQKQFIERDVKKCYVAVLNGELPLGEGIIDLPLIGDINDRPRQKVSTALGKKSLTYWQITKPAVAGKTTILLYPKTGRTHQLRVHCAHPEGLNTPMFGDDLYGEKANRLHLHAQQLTFLHPITKESMSFEVKPDF